MLKKDKNAFLDVIEEHALDPALFRTYKKEVEGHPAFILRLENTPLFFMARTSSSNFHEHDCRYIEFAPNYPKSDYFPNSEWCGIGQILHFFKIWLKEHVAVYLEEIETPDLWNQFQGSSVTQIDFDSPDAHAPFNKTEKQKIRNALFQFERELIAEYQPSNDEIKIVNERLSYLSKKLDELNKIDWQGVALTTLIGISIALNLDTEKGKVLFSMFKHAFKVALDLLK